jgi:hypothetical protein
VLSPENSFIYISESTTNYLEHTPSMLQWKTAVSVTRASVFKEIHFQKITSSVIVCAFILLFISMLKICSVFWAEIEHNSVCVPTKLLVNSIKVTHKHIFLLNVDATPKPNTPRERKREFEQQFIRIEEREIPNQVMSNSQLV